LQCAFWYSNDGAILGFESRVFFGIDLKDLSRKILGLKKIIRITSAYEKSKEKDQVPGSHTATSLLKINRKRYKVQGTRDKVQGTRDKVQGTRDKVQGTRHKEYFVRLPLRLRVAGSAEQGRQSLWQCSAVALAKAEGKSLQPGAI